MPFISVTEGQGASMKRALVACVMFMSAVLSSGQTALVRNCIAETAKSEGLPQKIRVSQGVLFGVVIATPDIKLEKDLSQKLKAAGEIRIKLAVNPEGKISCYE